MARGAGRGGPGGLLATRRGDRGYGIRLAAALAVAKREAFCRIAADCPGARLLTRGNLLVRVELPALTPAAMELHPGGGFFLETAAASLGALLPVCGEKCQTVTHYGVKREAFHAFLQTHRPRGADRMVPIGRALEFSLTWDGVDAADCP